MPITVMIGDKFYGYFDDAKDVLRFFSNVRNGKLQIADINVDMVDELDMDNPVLIHCSLKDEFILYNMKLRRNIPLPTIQSAVRHIISIGTFNKANKLNGDKIQHDLTENVDKGVVVVYDKEYVISKIIRVK